MLAIVDVGHVNPGHKLVLSKRHVETIEDADEDLAAHLFRIANRVAKGLRRAFTAEASTVLQAIRPAGFQTVSHFHLHVLPRHPEDGVDLTWPARNPPQEGRAANAEVLRKALRDLR